MRKKQEKRLVPLSDELERLVLCAMMQGLSSTAAVDPRELSKTGKIVHQAISNLRVQDPSSILSPEAVSVAATEVLGADVQEFRPYLQSVVAASAGASAPDLLRAVREKTLLVEVLNEAGSQLASGRLDLARVGTLCAGDELPGTLVDSASLIQHGFPEQLYGVGLRALPILTEFSGGFMGLWAFASEPGVGKSTLALQLAFEYTRVGPVLYYDAENGEETMLFRAGRYFNGDIRAASSKMQRLYFRESIRTLESDLREIRGQQALIVVDSLQKLPVSIEHRRTSLDSWVHRFERLKKDGHCVLLISEKNREEYGKATQRGFKETGEVEYSADFGAHLLPLGTDDMSQLKLVAVKNRHRPRLGYVCQLERDPGGFRFLERG